MFAACKTINPIDTIDTSPPTARRRNRLLSNKFASTRTRSVIYPLSPVCRSIYQPNETGSNSASAFQASPDTDKIPEIQTKPPIGYVHRAAVFVLGSSSGNRRDATNEAQPSDFFTLESQNLNIPISVFRWPPCRRNDESKTSQLDDFFLGVRRVLHQPYSDPTQRHHGRRLELLASDVRMRKCK